MSSGEGGGGAAMATSRSGRPSGSQVDLSAYVYVTLMVIIGSTTAAFAR
jgi:hypothetical protein